MGSVGLIVGYHAPGLTSTLCAPTVLNPEFHNPIFHPATQAARDKQNTNHSKSVCIGRAERASAVHGLFMMQMA